ncbi:VOC family protein [Alicyclobacillus kakegawensis]|uniref:VOC family protein n=1 Tax=Alicyclobacillus kakegawensis TaxID=392012 RepID=UPI00083462C8|nr:VOC family protein [Alicyclobacillus kakegawensis]
MRFVLDHVVHAVRDAHQARRTFAHRFPLATSEGGRHETWGTYNTLAHLGSVYVEWAAVFDSALAAANEFGRWLLYDLARGEGVSQLALRTDALDTVADAWRRAGLPFVGPVRGRRLRPDGLELTWRLLFPAREAGENFPLPFLIEWGSRPQGSVSADRTGPAAPGQLRNSGHGSEKEPGDAPVADGNLRLARMHALVQSPARTSERLSQYYGPFLPLPELRGEAVVWDVGGASLCLWPAASRRLPRSVEVLAIRGERVVAVDLARTVSAESASSGEGGQSLCPSAPEKGHLLHGLWVSMVPQSAGKS